MKSSSTKKIIFLYIAFALFLSCGKNEEESIEIPANILSEDSFTLILTDFALAESAANMNIKNVSIHKIDSTYAFDPLKENGISRSRYDSSVAFYSKHPQVYKKIYDNVVVRLSEMQAKRNPVKKDSVLK